MDISRLTAPFAMITTPDFHTLKVEWYDSLDELEMAGLKCAVEVSIRKAEHSNWDVIYLGRSDHCEYNKMEPALEYFVRLRLTMDDQFGPYGEEQKIEMPPEPNSGSDLHKAIKYEDVEQLRAILDAGQVNIEATDRCDFTPLMAVASRNLKNMVHILIKYGAKPNTANKLGKTALMIAANKGYTEIAEYLLNHGADPNIPDINGMNAIFYAVDGEYGNIVRLLVKSGANINLEDHDNQWTPLIRLACLANNGNARVGAALIDCGADVNHRDKYGQTALMHCAFHRNHVDLAKLLLASGADPDIKNKKNHTALDIARSLENHGFCSMMEKFKRTGIRGK
ncbi:Fibronectin type 3 and ankyrin repeat domain [Fasciola gigantica]|uniref:Fibronectin type 3 and ankyrin repeat domain n=1 Tax=Fasciola gigantica TaxID=46835 RepID=A0A504YL92_FASGI|nr:Fibronectin type 3 and ankyrin repeat domain [Fasciola gigantica]